MERAENGRSAFAIHNDDAIAARRNESVINSRHRILMTVRCTNREWNERHAPQSFTDLVDHGALYQKSAPAHYLVAVEPDIEIAAYAVDVRF